jgi:hypothetical protein
VQGAGEEFRLVGDLDDVAEIHNRDAMADVLDHRDRLAADADLSAGRVDQSKDSPARGLSYRIEVRLFATEIEYCRAERMGFMAIDLPQLRGLISAQVSLPAVSLPSRFGSLHAATSLPARPRREADRKSLICRIRGIRVQMGPKRVAPSEILTRRSPFPAIDCLAGSIFG